MKQSFRPEQINILKLRQDLITAELGLFFAFLDNNVVYRAEIGSKSINTLLVNALVFGSKKDLDYNVASYTDIAKNEPNLERELDMMTSLGLNMSDKISFIENNELLEIHITTPLDYSLIVSDQNIGNSCTLSLEGTNKFGQRIIVLKTNLPFNNCSINHYDELNLHLRYGVKDQENNNYYYDCDYLSNIGMPVPDGTEINNAFITLEYSFKCDGVPHKILWACINHSFYFGFVDNYVTKLVQFYSKK